MNERGCSIALGWMLIAIAIAVAILLFLGWKVTPSADTYTFETIAPVVLVPMIPAGLGILLIAYGRRDGA